MTETLFIADLHLSPQTSELVEKSIIFFKTRAQQADALYILGDLFEVWLGDETAVAYQPIMMALHELSQSTPVFIMRGNRDFLLGQQFAQLSGCSLITEDAKKIDIYGMPTLIMHGDTLCTLDVAYQQFRQQVRDPEWQQQFLSYPIEQRKALAQQAREQSQAETQQKQTEIMDVTSEVVAEVMQQHQVSDLIHGHTHRPTIHELKAGAKRYVVGDWKAEAKTQILSCRPNQTWLLDSI
ncbi:UDP-2,3-diacylglucosamine diphosphatase [Candidatus Albibeggiatoa sp. nov. BB20]|uniref:UDP-2,3-diacylglucosamine diphosphatase n=1 Tax=Candidatus Albibeggiatoa sp. nov. BB20 TaxID=3162723 RepID=UPI0033659DC1